MAKALNEAQLSSASGGLIRNATGAEKKALGGKDGIVVEGVMKNGKYGRMAFDGTKEGFAKATAFANRVGISTDMNTDEGTGSGSNVLKSFVPEDIS